MDEKECKELQFRNRLHGQNLVNKMLDEPGIYLVVAGYTMVCVEVDERKQAHQLNLSTFERDGILVADRWNLERITEIHGPLVRKT